MGDFSPQYYLLGLVVEDEPLELYTVMQGGIRVNILNATGHVIYALLGLQEPFVNSVDIT